MNLNLVSIIRDDPEFGRRISRKVEEIKKDKESLSEAANKYSELYKDEILQGTEVRAKLLTEGKSRGLTEEEALCQYGKFLPSVRTPLLNLLYFLLRESEDDRYYGNRHYEERNSINEQLVKDKKMIFDKEDDYGIVEMTEQEADKLLSKFIDDSFAPRSSDIRKNINTQFDNEERENIELKEPEKMEEFLYGHLTLDQFEILKKLKRMSLDKSNSHESFLAWKKCKELCDKYGLDFEKIPAYNSPKNNK